MSIDSRPPENPIRIRPAQLEDAELIRLMCWPHRSPEHMLHMLERTQKLAKNRRGLGVVGLWRGTVCAFGMLTLWPRAAEISDLHVNQNYRSLGIGSQIIRYLTEQAIDLETHTLEIGVALSNPRALALYRRLGFKDGRTIQIELGNGPEPVLYLYKTLALKG